MDHTNRGKSGQFIESSTTSEQGYETKLIKENNSKYKMNSTEYNAETIQFFA